MAKRTSPLKIDPSRTAAVRRAYVADLKRRFRALGRAIQKFLVEDDAFGLKPFDHLILHERYSTPCKLDNLEITIPFPKCEYDLETGNVTEVGNTEMVVEGVVKNTTPREYQFQTTAAKVVSFRRWLSQQINAGILQTETSKLKKPWTSKYIESAYKQGLIRAYLDTHAEDLQGRSKFYRGTKEQFLSTAFSQPEALDKVELLYTRSFNEMKGITDQMSRQMSNILADGLVHGEGPAKIARDLRNSMSGIEKKRALVIARTEIIHAHAEGQLRAFADLGVEAVGVDAEVEWSTAGDAKVCDFCSGMEGKVFTLEEASGKIPAHPNCFVDGGIPIMTSRGWVALRYVQTGMLVLTHRNRYKRVASVIRVPEQFPEVMEIQVERPPWVSVGQRRVVMTSDHPIRCGNGVWLKAGELQKGYLLKYYFEGGIGDVLIDGVRKWKLRKARTLYNLSVDADESYIAKGFVVHNCRCAWIPTVEKAPPRPKAVENVQKDDIEGRWVTVKGQHIFIKEGQSVEDAIKERFSGRKPLSEKAKKALKSMQIAGKKKQDLGEAMEHEVVKIVKGRGLPDNEPFDVLTFKWGIEVKTLIEGKNDKVTMHLDAIKRKSSYARKNGLRMGTVVFDLREKGKTMYWKKGVGSFRLSTMKQVTSQELQTIVGGSK